MFLLILVVTTALCGGVRSEGRPPPGGHGGPDGHGPDGPEHGPPPPGPQPSGPPPTGSPQGSPPPPSGGGDGGGGGDGDGAGAPRAGAGANLSWLGIVFGTIAGAALLIALVALALVLCLCCWRKRSRGRDERMPPVVIVQKSFEKAPVFVVADVKEKEQALAPPSYESTISKPPSSPTGSKSNDANSLRPKPSNRSSTSAATPSAPPLSVRRVKSPLTQRGAEEEKDSR